MDAIASTLEETETPLCRAMLYQTLSLGFLFPSDKTLSRLRATGAGDILSEAAAALDPENEYRLPTLAAAVAQSQDLHDHDVLTNNFTVLFGHTARGVVPPYETEYGKDAPFLQPQELSDIGGFFGAFGLAHDAACRERVDHISCECEFMSFLCVKETYAFEEGDEETLEETRNAQRLFLRDHLGRFAATFGRKLAREDPLGFYGRLGNLCVSFMLAECTRLNMPEALDNLPLRPPATDGAPTVCGTADCPELDTAQAPFLETGEKISFSSKKEYRIGEHGE